MDELQPKDSSALVNNSNSGVIVSHKLASQLDSEIKDAVGNPFTTFIPNRPKFVGFASDGKFSVFRNGWTRNDFRRRLYIEIRSTANGSELRYKFETPIFIKAFMAVWITTVAGGALFFLTSYLISKPKDPDLLFGVFIASLMTCFGLAMFKWAYLFKREEEDEALEFVKSIASSDTQRRFD